MNTTSLRVDLNSDGLYALTRLTRRTHPDIPKLILASTSDMARVFRDAHMVGSSVPAPNFMGIRIVEDPGLEPGAVELVMSEEASDSRLHLIRLGLTVTPDGLIKPADWWRKRPRSGEPSST
ncbi:hypothetical protein HAP47_0022280 [Bradyrhizobium sp. 41S5]|uniref:hypothetical protein n=1 Tax=Bradyrhizobium sp. 41S5 TaxID=1404443 RepID=UPI00156B98B0|nr:hypothetical protein [Bradyrhizobium sp. 41S5]UFX42020.1 hypothetical protein HAP47_0022280 [Bradyrhizobium sp. 41S5]